MIYRAKDGERLDIIVFKHYGHLRYFEQVLELNAKCEPILKAGDVVILPTIKENLTKKELKSLW